MSTINQTITIKPCESGKNEIFTVHNFRCPRCNGRREFIKEVGHDQYESTPCALCQGKGQLQAKLIIGWSPDI